MLLTVYRFAKKDADFTKVVALLAIVYLVTPLAINYAKAEEWLFAMIILRIVKQVILANWLEPMISNMSIIINQAIVTDGMKRFHSMTPEMQHKKDVKKFEFILKDAAEAAMACIDWGFLRMIQTISSFLMCVFMFWYYGYIGYFLIVFILSLPLAFNWLKGAKAFTNAEKKVRKDNRKVSAEVSMLMPRFQVRDVSANYVATRINHITENRKTLHLQWNLLQNKLGIYNELLFIPVIYAGMWKDLSLPVTEFGIALMAVAQFLTMATKFLSQWQDYEEFWPAPEHFRPAPKPMPIPAIMRVSIKAPKLRTHWPITICQGDKIRLMGRSGEGKTTLTQMLFGQLAGAKIKRIADPFALEHEHYAYYQSIKSKMSCGPVPILYYFDGWQTEDIPLIHKLLKRVWLDKYDDILEQIGGINQDIDNKLSGGQHSRLCLAMVAWRVIKDGKKFIILDEPMNDVDEETYVAVMRWFFKWFHDRTILLIAHIDKSREQALNIKWDKILTIANGRITQKNN